MSHHDAKTAVSGMLNNCRILLLVTAALLPVAQASADTGLWQVLKKGGHILLIRHAATDPGVGDPAEFQLDKCETQRNLSSAGREDARQLGSSLRQKGIPVAAVRSSRWCRCLDTAQLAFGDAQPWPPLDNTFETPERRPAQMREIRKLLSQPMATGNLALVTHGVNIMALTGISPEQGEIIAIRPGRDGKFTVIGRGIPWH